MNLAQKTLNFLKTFTLPGFDQLPLWEVLKFLIKSLNKSALTVRASSISYNLFLALFPALIFFFSALAYVPISGFTHELLRLLKEVMPTNAYLTIRSTIIDIIQYKRAGLLSFGFVSTLYFATNGMNALIAAFNATELTYDNRNWFQRRVVAFILLLIFSILIILAIALLIFSQSFFNFLVEQDFIRTGILLWLLKLAKWIIVLSCFFFSISFLYYFAPARKSKFKLISAGSTLATLLVLLVSLGFSYYVNNFGQYNKLYGSLGTLIVLMLWIYFNSLALLIGYELNWSIRHTKQKLKELKHQSS
ncbi:MAG: YihY/virulence factor BrkB family protein [Bacteroidales bacterium]|nr:YihY/virulence factor BrkB family protein [Bacteroidales bacterium]